MYKSNKITALAANYHGSRLLVLIIATTLLLPAQPVFADACDDAQEYYQLYMQAQIDGVNAIRANPFNVPAAVYYGGLATKYRGLYEEAQAQCDQLQNSQQGEPSASSEMPENNKQTDNNQADNNQTDNNNANPAPTGPPAAVNNNRPILTPVRTGLDWRPFLEDLKPRAVASQIRQGDHFADKGNWPAAAKCYDLAARIDPTAKQARQKAIEARKNLKPPEEIPETQPALTQPQPATKTSTTPDAVDKEAQAAKVAQAKQEAQTTNAESNFIKNPNPDTAQAVKNATQAQAKWRPLRFPDDTPYLGEPTKAIYQPLTPAKGGGNQ